MFKEKKCFQSGPRLRYQHPRRHFLLNICSWSHGSSHTRPEGYERPRLREETDKGLIRLEWSERWNKSSTNSSFGPPGYDVRDEGTRKTRRATTWFNEWPPSITHFRGRRNSGGNRLKARMKTAGELRELNEHTQTDVSPHSWAQNRFFLLNSSLICAKHWRKFEL